MRSLYRVIVCSFLLAAAACRDAAAPDLGSEQPGDPSKSPTVPFNPGSTRVELYTAEWFTASVNPAQPVGSIVVIEGQRVFLWVKATDANGNLAPIQSASFSSSDTLLVKVRAVQQCTAVKAGCYLAQVSSAGTGEAKVTATINGVSSTITVRSFLQPSMSDLVHMEFTVLKLETGSYAPQLRVSVPAGAPDVDIVGLTLMIPGTATWRLCTARHVVSGQTAEMFGQYYGDYEIEFDGGIGTGDWKAIMYFFLPDGTISSTSVIGEVIPGAPAEYRGGAPQSPWTYCGSGARANVRISRQ